VKEKAEMKETPVTPGDMSRGPKLMNCLEARSNTAAGCGEETKVGRDSKGFVNDFEDLAVLEVSSATGLAVQLTLDSEEMGA
jgi:hypothetical protein